MDILKAFDEYFAEGLPNADSPALREYCLWLVRNKKGKAPGQAESATMRKDDEWFARCEGLCREAEALARSGVQRGELAFDDLKKRSLALADEVFSGPRRRRGEARRVYGQSRRGDQPSSQSRQNPRLSPARPRRQASPAPRPRQGCSAV